MVPAETLRGVLEPLIHKYGTGRWTFTGVGHSYCVEYGKRPGRVTASVVDWMASPLYGIRQMP